MTNGMATGKKSWNFISIQCEQVLTNTAFKGLELIRSKEGSVFICEAQEKFCISMFNLAKAGQLGVFSHTVDVENGFSKKISAACVSLLQCDCRNMEFK